MIRYLGHRSTLGAHMALRTHKSPMAVGVTYDRYSMTGRSARPPTTTTTNPARPSLVPKTAARAVR